MIGFGLTTHLVHRKVHCVEMKGKKIATVSLIWLAPCTFISIAHNKTKPTYNGHKIQLLVGKNITFHPGVFFRWTILPLKKNHPPIM